ncbi:MAG: DUF4265 domain-containing protein [Burkholderiales bacterium]|nr:DUF4265 domain-containing protein [Burkholderiales bacterium]MBH2015940.1 DUF4265 domain-containing protein [Burkholderiales bacterium]
MPNESTPDPDLVKICVELPHHWWLKGESFWAQPLGQDLYRLENVPFCAYDLNFGDVVQATADREDLKPEIRAVVERSGHQTLRIRFSDPLNREAQEPVIAALQALGGELERANGQFLAIDIPPGVSIDALRDALDEQVDAGALEYETCEARVPGSFDAAP